MSCAARVVHTGATETTMVAVTPLPKFQLFILLYVQMAEPLSAFVIYPFINQMIYEYGITHGDKTTVGYFAGSVNTLFFVTEMICVLFWGRVSDRIGRRPVILTGLCGLMLSITLFGLSKTFLTLVISRALSGALNGNVGVMKSVMAEITDETNQARAFSYMPLVFAVGTGIANFIGGGLSHPYERFPAIFGRSTFWKDYPYALPCFVPALFCVSAILLASLSLKETLNFKDLDKANGHYGTFATNEHGVVNVRSGATTSLLSTSSGILSLRKILTPRVRVAILNNGTFALLNIALVSLQPLILSTPISLGGLGLSAPTIGLVLGVNGITTGIFQVVLFAPLHRQFGSRTIFIGSLASYLIVYLSWPLMNFLARRAGKIGAGVIIVLAMQQVVIAFLWMGFSCSYIFITSAAPTRTSLGTTTGLCQSFVSLVRAIGPATASSLFVLSVRGDLLGGQFLYVVLVLLVLVALAASSYLPKEETRASNDHID